MVADEPVTAVQLATVLGMPPVRWSPCSPALPRSTGDDDRAAAGLRAARGRRRLADLLRPGARRRRRTIRARRAAGPAHPGRAGDARGDRLPPAGDPGRRSRRSAGSTSSGDAHPAHAGPYRGGRVRRRAAPSCTAPPPTSWSGWGWQVSTSCRRWRPTCPTSTRARRNRRGRRDERHVDQHDPDGVRLQKLLAAAGRRLAARLRGAHRAGRVEVDGQVVTRARRAGRPADRRRARGRHAGVQLDASRRLPRA